MKPTPDRFERWRKSREKGGLSLHGVRPGWGGWRGNRWLRSANPASTPGVNTAFGGKGPRGALKRVAERDGAGARPEGQRAWLGPRTTHL